MSEKISVFDMLKIGVGPSSSHTLGPWRAAQKFLKDLDRLQVFDQTKSVQIDLYGSLSLTGKGHATDFAVMLGLMGLDAETIDTSSIGSTIENVRKDQKLNLGGLKFISFNPDTDIIFNRNFLPFHANGIKFSAFADYIIHEATYYSLGGGFIAKEENVDDVYIPDGQTAFPYPIETAKDLLRHCHNTGKNISQVVWENEKSLKEESEITKDLLHIWSTMLESMYVGCHSPGILPGGLNVKRRAYDLHLKLIGDSQYKDAQQWIQSIRNSEVKFRQILQWVSCYALAVNEVNASLGRVVTAPTNGSAGVIPAVLMYYLTIENHDASEKEIIDFLLVAGEVGSIFKKGATISAAMGGCQAEIGVSSAMAAAALCQLLGGNVDQVLVAAEIAMEHHLGLTCDPVGGLVQVPCIERNAMGAIKAINAAELAINTNAKDVKVPLDQVINTMWETAKDMNAKYKETSEGGLAVAVNLVDC
ncbi:MAG TPA: L-serine ammonia-lyase [Saprospiraceae bacterium]|nr:L-serine ammonia-lyase [Saprospiraceae bacterium]